MNGGLSYVGMCFSKNWLITGIMRRCVVEAVRYGCGRMLDVGCGGQPYRDLFAQAVSSYVGLDRRSDLYPSSRVAPSPRYAASSRYSGIRGVSRERGIPFNQAVSRPDVKGDAQALPFRAGAFGTVLCNQVLEHLPEPNRAMEEMGRVLRPGGHLILTAPHIWGIHEEPHDYYRFTRYGLSYLMERAGLEVVEVRAMAGYWVTAGARFCYYLESFERGLLKPFIRLAYGLVQCCALLLDCVHRVEGDTWNYIAIGKKPG